MKNKRTLKTFEADIIFRFLSSSGILLPLIFVVVISFQFNDLYKPRFQLDWDLTTAVAHRVFFFFLTYSLKILQFGNFYLLLRNMFEVSIILDNVLFYTGNCTLSKILRSFSLFKSNFYFIYFENKPTAQFITDFRKYGLVI